MHVPALRVQFSTLYHKMARGFIGLIHFVAIMTDAQRQKTFSGSGFRHGEKQNVIFFRNGYA